MDKKATMTATPDEIVTKLVDKHAVMKRWNGLAPEALLFGPKGGKGGNAGKAGKGGRSPKRDKRDDKRESKDDRREKDLQKSFHCKR